MSRWVGRWVGRSVVIPLLVREKSTKAEGHNPKLSSVPFSSFCTGGVMYDGCQSLTKTTGNIKDT